MSRRSHLSKSLIESDLSRANERPENSAQNGWWKRNCNWMERFKKMTLGKQIWIWVFFSLVIVFTVLLGVIVINLRILMGNTNRKISN